ncbi:HTH-type transcriptional repressor YvoA [Variovorax sp. PBL-H6]|uniref:GntR family transcriptional regulator n=1 Tax=Variovorax sp. PBL-H6 TaxID=434009 RepID=UPI00131822E5|nr:GntR family transcriptional regulator [Variovorax sp. PBL-H6]VTU23207.1 HTH-type transcriptional repressor YvoA [Variovorax sp. PBL-H6]
MDESTRKPAEANATTVAAPSGDKAHADAVEHDLDRSSALPLYAQVKRRLQAIIRTGVPGDGKFYSDQELCAMFGVSRFTVRQAIQELVAQGLLRRVQGQGTFVNTDKFDEIFGPQMDFKHQWERIGRPLTFKLKRFAMLPCPEDMAFHLGIGADQSVLHIERVRQTGPTIASYDFRYIHPDFAASITEAEAARHSLLDLLARRTSLSHAQNRLEASLADARTAKLLGVALDSPVMVRELAYYCTEGLPVMAGRSYSPGGVLRHAFTVALSPPAGGNTNPPVDPGPKTALEDHD